MENKELLAIFSRDPKEYLNSIRERELAIALNNYVNRFEEAKKPNEDTPMHEIMLYSAAKQYLLATR